MVKKIPEWLVLIVFMVAGVNSAGIAADNPPRFDADRLFAFIREKDHRDPLVAFGPAENRVNQALSRENRTYLSRNQALLERIRTELASEALEWQLAQASARLMIVPENRAAYAALFEDYCQTAVNHVLQKTRLPDPYQAIITVRDPLSPVQPPTGAGGITAFVVHNIADVYTEEYVFWAATDSAPQIRIKLSNRSYTGEVGSYTSYLLVAENGQIEFLRNPYTLWRNRADDPLNVLIAPIEETLHIALRDATEEAIRHRVAALAPATRPALEAVVAEWLAIEEAVVGGLVRKLMPEIMERFLTTNSRANLDSTLHARRAFDKYRYLHQGIRIVEEMGTEACIDLYRQKPQAFRAMLIQRPEASPPLNTSISGPPSGTEPALPSPWPHRPPAASKTAQDAAAAADRVPARIQTTSPAPSAATDIQRQASAASAG